MSTPIPESTKKFIVSLNRALQRKKVYEIQHLYESEYPYQTSKHYKAAPWPTGAAISDMVDNDENFLVLYKQLYYRHLYVRKLAVDITGHFASFQNYIELFNILLGLTREAPEFEIPSSWCWDMMDEFVYQFSSFHSFRSSPDMTESDKAQLEKQPHAWSAQTVVTFLLYFARNGDVMPGMSKPTSGVEPHIIFEALGIYALIGMLRVNTIMGDYIGGIELVEDIDFSGAHEHICVPAAHASLHYHLSFAYLVTRQYADCIRCAREGLLYLARNKALIPRTYQQNNINKMQEQMFGILALATSLVPQSLNEGLGQIMRERYTQQLQRMRNMDLDAYKEVFCSVAPKFVPVSVTNDTKASLSEGLEMQCEVFLNEVRAVQKIPDIYSYLKMCTSINVKRLATFLGEDMDAIPRRLLYLKHKTHSGSKYSRKNRMDSKMLEGKKTKDTSSGTKTKETSSDIQFMISEGMVHIAERKKEKQHADFFIREILRYEYIIGEVQASRRLMYF